MSRNGRAGISTLNLIGIRFEPGSAPSDIAVERVVIITQAGHPYYGEPAVVVRRGHTDSSEVVVRHADGRHWAIAVAGLTAAGPAVHLPPEPVAPPLLDLARLRQLVHRVAVLPPPAPSGPPAPVVRPPP